MTATIAQFTAGSEEKLKQTHPDLVMVMRKARELFNFIIIEGHRGQVLQHEYFVTGKSKVDWPNGEHNKIPSHANDVAPVDVDGTIKWNDINTFHNLAFFIKGVAWGMGIELRIGADFNGDFKRNDSFVDGPHVELLAKWVNGVRIKY